MISPKICAPAGGGIQKCQHGKWYLGAKAHEKSRKACGWHRFGCCKIFDLTHTLAPDFPAIILPQKFGKCARFRMDEISSYDHHGLACEWHNITLSEQTGTHFDAPSHWISGRDLPNGSVDEIPVEGFVGPVVVIDCSAGAATNGDFAFTPNFIKLRETVNGGIPAGVWVLMRTAWSERSGSECFDMREDGPDSSGPTPEGIRFLTDEGDIRGFGTETAGTDAGQGRSMFLHTPRTLSAWCRQVRSSVSGQPRSTPTRWNSPFRTVPKNQ